MQYDEIYARAVQVLETSGLSEKWLDLGCETGSQNRLNRANMDRFVFETNLIGARAATTATSFLDLELDSPVVGSTMARGRALENIKHATVPWFETPPYVEEMAEALDKCGSIIGVGAVEINDLAGIARRGARFYHIVKPMPDEGKIRAHFEAAAEHGAVAVGMDITPIFGHKAWDENPANDTGVAPKTAEQLASYAQITSLPFIVKGVLSVRDAQLSQEIGASAVVVSNHGGECIDYTRPVLHALRDIRAACPDLPIMVDSGFRRGTDALKALCLGANVVGIVTPLVIGFAAAGTLGVEAMYRAIVAELQRTMSACGYPDVASIDDAALHELAA